MDVDAGVEPEERKASSSDASIPIERENQEKKTRFEVELKSGETTIVSWKNLISKARNENASSASDTSLNNDAIVVFRNPPTVMFLFFVNPFFGSLLCYSLLASIHVQFLFLRFKFNLFSLSD